MGVEANYVRGGTRVLRVLAAFREYMLRALGKSKGSTLLILSTPTNSDVCTAGTACCTRGSVPSQYSQCSDLQYSYCSYSQHAQYLGHHVLEYCITTNPKYRTPQYCQHRQPQKKRIEHHSYEHVRCSSIMHRHTYLPTYSIINGSIWSPAVVLLLGIM